MGAHCIRRMMPVGNDPSLVAVGIEVPLDPLYLGAQGVIHPVLVFLYPIGVKGKKMDISDIEGIKSGVVRSDSAGFPVDRHGKVLIIGYLVGMLHLFFRRVPVIIIVIAGGRV